ncbi:MAG TPA: hypothetical protein VIT23_15675, partial [Terrimicrobiaceae bacterium]
EGVSPFEEGPVTKDTKTADPPRAQAARLRIARSSAIIGIVLIAMAGISAFYGTQLARETLLTI